MDHGIRLIRLLEAAVGVLVAVASDMKDKLVARLSRLTAQ